MVHVMVAMFQDTDELTPVPDIVAMLQGTDAPTPVPDTIATLPGTEEVTPGPDSVAMVHGHGHEVIFVPDDSNNPGHRRCPSSA